MKLQTCQAVLGNASLPDENEFEFVRHTSHTSSKIEHGTKKGNAAFQMPDGRMLRMLRVMGSVFPGQAPNFDHAHM
eukprot:2684627-Amphidinium_carterae.1